MPAPAQRLAEKEFAVILAIAKNPAHTQRSLSQNVGLSLGTTNLLVQRLARKGLIKAKQLDWKRTQYLLTLKGALEKTRKTFHYTLYTVRLFRQIRENMATMLRREYAQGRRRFSLVAQDEILDLLREAVRELNFPDAFFSYYRDFREVPADADLVLAATLDNPPSPQNGRKYVSLVDFDNIDFRLN